MENLVSTGHSTIDEIFVLQKVVNKTLKRKTIMLFQ
jgi:hypothetical protein